MTYEGAVKLTRRRRVFLLHVPILCSAGYQKCQSKYRFYRNIVIIYYMENVSLAGITATIVTPTSLMTRAVHKISRSVRILILILLPSLYAHSPLCVRHTTLAASTRRVSNSTT